MIEDDHCDNLKWFVIGKTVHLRSHHDEGTNLSMCREKTGKAFITKPRETGSGWSDTIERLGVCRACWSVFEASLDAQPALALEEPLGADSESGSESLKAVTTPSSDSE